MDYIFIGGFYFGFNQSRWQKPHMHSYFTKTLHMAFTSATN